MKYLLLFFLLVSLMLDLSAAPSKRKKKRIYRKAKASHSRVVKKTKRRNLKSRAKAYAPTRYSYIKSDAPPPLDVRQVAGIVKCHQYFCLVRFQDGTEGFSEIYEVGSFVYAPKPGALYTSKEKIERRRKENQELREASK